MAQTKGRLYVLPDSQGRTIIGVLPKWSLAQWLKNTFGNRNARKVIHDQVLQALVNDSTPKSLKERLVKDVIWKFGITATLSQ